MISLKNSKLALLWLIRRYGPISINEIFDNTKKWKDEGIPPEVAQILDYTSLRHMALRDIDTLEAAGLVRREIKNQNIGWDDRKISTTDELGRIQDLFGISLSRKLRTGAADFYVDAFPIFGAPLSLHKNWARVFVAMPFLQDLKPVYQDHILPSVLSLGVTCKRGDDFFSANNIMDEVWSAIFHSELCIVDCTGRNPNVFYELGIAHTLGRKAILIAQSINDIPFDIRQYRVIVYSYTPPGMKEFEAALKKTITTELGLADA